MSIIFRDDPNIGTFSENVHARSEIIDDTIKRGWGIHIESEYIIGEQLARLLRHLALDMLVLCLVLNSNKKLLYS